MRLLFSARPAFGHVFTMMPLALAARDVGHEVIFGTGTAFEDRIKSWGFPFEKVGRGIEAAFEETAGKYPHLLQPETPEFGATMFVDVLGKQTLEDLTGVLERTHPDMVVYEATDVGAAVAAAQAGVPAVCHALAGWRSIFLDALRRHAESLWEQTRAERRVDVTTGDVYLDMWPPSMQARDEELPANRWALRPVPWSDPHASTPVWPARGAGPRVFVSLGTIFWGKELLRKVIAGLSALDVNALVLAGVDATPEDLRIADERVIVTGFVNQADVLAQSDIVINHGGAGTMLGALSHGLPQLVLPEGADRPMNAESLTQVEAGIVLPPPQVTPEGIAEAVTRLIDEPPFRERAEEIAAEIGAMPAPPEVVDRLKTLVD